MARSLRQATGHGDSADYAPLIKPEDLSKAGEFAVTGVHKADTQFGARVVLHVTLLEASEQYAVGEQYGCMLALEDQNGKRFGFREELLDLFKDSDEIIGPCVLIRGGKGNKPWLLNDVKPEKEGAD